MRRGPKVQRDHHCRRTRLTSGGGGQTLGERPAQTVQRCATAFRCGNRFGDLVGDSAIEAAQCRALVARRVDGVIFAALAEDSTSLGDLLDRGVPTMLASFGGTLDRRAGAIDIDEEEAMDAVILAVLWLVVTAQVAPPWCAFR